MRNAFVMKLKSGCEAEYKKRHEHIWPEVERELSAAGISDYSIFRDPRTNYLFAVQKLADNHSASRLPEAAIMQKWWNYMKDIMDSNPDNSPAVRPLQEMYHLD